MNKPDPADILKNNIYIAKWMEYEVKVVFEHRKEFGRGNSKRFVVTGIGEVPACRKPKDLEFHSDWNWFMGVYRVVWTVLSGDENVTDRLRQIEHYVMCANLGKAYEQLTCLVFYCLENNIKPLL